MVRVHVCRVGVQLWGGVQGRTHGCGVFLGGEERGGGRSMYQREIRVHPPKKLNSPKLVDYRYSPKPVDYRYSR